MYFHTDWPFKNAHNSLTTWYILITFSILIHFNIVYCLDIDAGMQKGDEAWPSISLAGRGQLAKMQPHGTMYILIKVFLLIYFNIGCSLVYMQNGDKALPKTSTAFPAAPTIGPTPASPDNCPRLPKYRFTMCHAQYD